ncbi:MAG: lysophospholipid acyltransferase family protein [Gemmatimonadota bacterium]|nr:lysophospholipid acyltransferase family protein [Gemmatimonadota bacterium]
MSGGDPGAPEKEPETGRPEEPYRGELRGRFSRAIFPFATWLAAQLTIPFILTVFFLLNRTRVYGRSRIPMRPNTLLLSNHQSMIDSFLLVFVAFFPRELFEPRLLPWHPAAEENFFRNRFYTWVFSMLKCIPVRPGRRDLKAIHRSLRALRDGTMILFPEGTRSRDGSVGRGRPGAGLVLLGTGATVIPVTITGLDRVLPIGSIVPRVGNRVRVYFGRPVDYSDLADLPPSRETAQEAVDRVMERIRFQRRVIERIEGRGRV